MCVQSSIARGGVDQSDQARDPDDHASPDSPHHGEDLICAYHLHTHRHRYCHIDWTMKYGMDIHRRVD